MTSEENRAVFHPAEGRKHPKVFGSILRQWLTESGRPNNTLAIRLGVHSSEVSRWITGKRKPNCTKVTHALICLHSWLKEDWQVEQALDGIIWLGFGWEDVAGSLREDFQSDSVLDSFRKWWEEGRPERQTISIGFMPSDYVEPEALEDLRLLVTGMRGYRQPAFNHVVVRGISGAGKTTLALALARSAMVDWTFRDGLIWLDGRADDLNKEARRKAEGGYDSEEGWTQWIGSADRRLLIIIDDLVDVKRLGALLKHTGPQVTVVVTTQKGEDVMLEMTRWAPDDQLTDVEVKGLSKRTARVFVEKVSGQRLTEAEWEWVEEIGEHVGWHPEGLRLATEKARDETWSGVLSDLKNVAGSNLLLLLEDWIGKHWQRMKQQDREQAWRLLHRMEGGWPFGVWFASAAWDIGPDEARTRLSRLERQGLIERLEAGHKLPWQGEGRVYDQWRPLPLVYRVIVERSKGGLDREIRESWWKWRQRVLSAYRDRGAPHPPPSPWVFKGVALAWSVGFGIVKGIGYLLLILLGLVFPRQRWVPRWNDGSIVLAVKDHIKARWDKQGIQPTEGLWLIYRVNDRLAQVASIVLPGVALILFSHPGVTLLLSLMTLTAAASYFSWCTWLASLYGVHTWDLELMLRVSLWLTRKLSWIPALRADQDALREALERVREGRDE